MKRIQKAIDFAVNIAEDNTQGYDQIHRFGPDWDCSSLVNTAWENAQVPVKQLGATYTGNMKPAYLKAGFVEVIKSINLLNGSGLIPGDVLLRTTGHTALYIGDGKIVQAQGNEKGGKIGGKPGDQTGKEIFIRSYYNSPWDSVLRYVETEENNMSIPYSEPTKTYVKNVYFAGNDASWFQWLLQKIGHDIDVDGKAGPKTWEALNYEISQAGLTGDAGVPVREYLKRVAGQMSAPTITPPPAQDAKEKQIADLIQQNSDLMKKIEAAKKALG